VFGRKGMMLLRSALAILVPLSLAVAQQTTIRKVPAPHTSPAASAEMYAAYCASCHGADGKGGGPAAPALKVRPPDLTTLAKKNNGRFPGGRVYQVIKWGGSIAAHGSKDMPVWGPAFRSLSDAGEPEVELRIKNIVTYLEGLQTK
jgi:mono/diheme cytochrome c family protein